MNNSAIILNFETRNFSEKGLDLLFIYLDNKLMMLRDRNGENQFTMSLSEGEHQVKVMFYISTKGATVTIKSIDVMNA